MSHNATPLSFPYTLPANVFQNSTPPVCLMTSQQYDIIMLFSRPQRT